MLKDLNERLIKVKENIYLFEKYSNDKKGVMDRLREKENQLSTLERSMNKEKYDVDKLEGMSIKGLFYSILGSKETQMEKERQEFLNAKLKYDECKNQVDYLKSQIDFLTEKLNSIVNPYNEYNNIISEKERILKNMNDDRVEKFDEFVSKEARLKADYKEISEALYAGKQALEALKRMLNNLDSAEGWGTWDMLGGGFIATAAKHSKIDGAKYEAGIVQEYLSRFRTELGDVRNISGGNLNVNIGSFETFADYFFDGLISDWIVQSRIHESLENTRRTYSQVANVISRLESMEKQINIQIESIIKEKTSFIEGLQ